MLLLQWVLGAAVTAMWALDSPSWRPALGWILLALAGAFAGWRWWHGASGTLDWDGKGWSWSCQPDAQPGALEVSLDFQRGLLLRWRSGSASQWLWLEHAARPERWDDLRRAVYSRARIEALRAGRPPAAKP